MNGTDVSKLVDYGHVRAQLSQIAMQPKNTVVLLGDSITFYNGQGDDIVTTDPNIYKLLAIGPFVWANVLLGQRLNLLRNLGVGSETTTQILARVNAVIELNPAYCIVLGGTNDAVTNWNTTTTKANLLAIYQALINAGIIVVSMTIPPRDDITDALKTKLIECNNYIRSLRSTLKNYIVCDIYEALADVTDDDYATGLSSDGVHPSTKGAYEMGKKLFDVFDAIIPPISVFSGSSLDAANPVANPYLLGGATLATGWEVQTSATYTASKVARTNGMEWQQFDVTSVGAGTIAFLQIMYSGISVGDKLTAYIEYELGSDASLIDEYSVSLTATNASWQAVATGIGLAGNSYPQAITQGVLRTPRFTVPVGMSQVALTINMKLKGKIRFGRTRVVKE